jgi:uncharacterized protein (DUF362 family)
MKKKVVIQAYEARQHSLASAIELAQGFQNLKKEDRILIKPNLVSWDTSITQPPYGVLTTTRIIEDLIQILQGEGCTAITIGEGSVIMGNGAGTKEAFQGLGYTQLAEKYGVNLIDFNDSASIVHKTPEGMAVNVAKDAIETDFFINVPVLKTHSQTKISLGIKNLKGCLKATSKKQFHHPQNGLDHSIQYLPEFIKPNLTIIDGIYALEQGPLYYGKAIRKNILVVSTDLVGADLVGAKLIGYEASQIRHLTEYATRSSCSLSIDDYEILGEPIAQHITPLKWDWEWNTDNTGPSAFDKLGIHNIALPKYDETLCSGCSPLSNMMNILVLSSPKDKPLPHIEVLNGKKMLARPGYEQTLLLGNCIIAANKGNPAISKAVKVVGCPPEEGAVMEALRTVGLNFDPNAYERYLQKQALKYAQKPEFDFGFFQSERVNK